MIYFIQGNVIDIINNYVIMNWHGIGFRIITNNLNLEKEKEYRFYLFEKVFDDKKIYYGFLQKEELNLFLKLMEIRGIGPNIAISLLSTYTLDQLYHYIYGSNIKALTKIKGISKVIALKIINHFTNQETEFSQLYQILLPLGISNEHINNYLITHDCSKYNIEELANKIIKAANK